MLGLFGVALSKRRAEKTIEAIPFPIELFLFPDGRQAPFSGDGRMPCNGRLLEKPALYWERKKNERAATFAQGHLSLTYSLAGNLFHLDALKERLI